MSKWPFFRISIVGTLTVVYFELEAYRVECPLKVTPDDCKTVIIHPSSVYVEVASCGSSKWKSSCDSFLRHSFKVQINMVANTRFLFSSKGANFIGFVDLPVWLVFAFLPKLKIYPGGCFTKYLYQDKKFLKPLLQMSMLEALRSFYRFLA